LQVWDAVRSLDVLAAHPLVDPKRLASTGQSGGGTLTMLLAAVDDRLAAAAVSCGNTENFAGAGFDPPGSTDDAEQDFIASGAVGFDRWDLLYPMAAKPLLIAASARDFFGTYSPQYLASGRDEYKKLESVYGVMGAKERIEWVETPAPHALAHFLRTRIYGWFERWLKDGAGGEIAEPPVAPERDETLWVGRTGNAVRDFGSKTPLRLARERMASLGPGRTDAVRLRQLLGLDAAHEGTAAELGRVPSEACELVAIEVPTAPKVMAPAWLFVPRKIDASKPAMLIVEPRGRSARWGEGALYHQLAAAGVVVCAADIRGIGDLWPEVARGNPHYTIPHATEEAYAWAGLILGKPLVGQRVTDLLAFVRAFGSMEATRGRRIVLAATGHLTIPALFASALDRRIERTYLEGGLVTYRSLLDVEEYEQPTANFLPGVLEVCDLPDVAALAAPRRIVAAGGVDPAYARIPNVELRPESRWDFESLVGL
jgi:cephalosporin-C deacetylase-like acetyl esterase